MNAARKIGSLGSLTLTFLLVAFPAGAQKSLSDGVDELAAKLAKSYGDGKHGKVAIVPLRELGGDEDLLGAYIADTLTNSFFEVGYRDIVERQMLDRAIKELKLQYTGMIDPESAKKLGKFLHADLVVSGTITDLTGEVSVNCRIFAVETGQIVAVATTKIVKDDNVKSMLAKRKAVSGGGNERDSASAESEPTGETVQEVQGISFRLKSCAHRGTTIDCELSVTALDDDARIEVSSRSRLVDAHGNETEAAFLSFSGGDSSRTRGRVGGFSGTPSGGSLELVRGVVRTGHLRFEGIEVTGGKVPLIEVRFGGITSFSTRNAVRDGRIQFRNVIVK